MINQFQKKLLPNVLCARTCRLINFRYQFDVAKVSFHLCCGYFGNGKLAVGAARPLRSKLSKAITSDPQRIRRVIVQLFAPQLSCIWQLRKQKPRQQSVSLPRPARGTYCPVFPCLGRCYRYIAKTSQKKLYHIQTFRHTQSHSLSCFEVPHVCRGTPGLLIIALPADLRASILRCVSSPAGGFPKSPGPQGGKYSRG